MITCELEMVPLKEQRVALSFVELEAMILYHKEIKCGCSFLVTHSSKGEDLEHCGQFIV